MFFHRRTILGLAIHSYLIGDENSGECAVIDPVRDVEEYLHIADENGLIITHILETHVHADFISGSKELKDATNGKAVIHCSGLGGEEWIPSYADHIVQDGDGVVIGNLTLKAVHTPGHTPEHIMWSLSEGDELLKLFTGDFLFVGAVGRPDLLGKEEMKRLAHQLYHSVFEKLDPFPDTVEVRPAHGAGSLCGKALGSTPYSSLGVERAHNASLVEKSEQEWVHELMHDMPPVPQYFPRMKEVNVQGADLVSSVVRDIGPLTVEEVKNHIQKGATVLDLRAKEAFAAAHISGSISIPMGPQLSTWAGWVLPYPNQVVLVLEEQEHLKPAVNQLLRIGYDQIAGFLRGGIKEWEDSGNDLASYKVFSAKDLHKKLNETYVLDIRTQDEWNRGHIEGAHHLHGGLIPEKIDQIPKDKSIAIVCGSGFRASIAASLLKRAGYPDVANVFGGMQAWVQDGYPVES